MVTDAPAITLVLKEELVFRAVADNPQLWGTDQAGGLRLSGSAFNDRNKEPSVDRESLLALGAAQSRKSESDGVACLLTGEVRAIRTVVTLDAKQQPVREHIVDVVHVPVTDNAAHAVVRTDPLVSNDGAFRRLKEALCLLANTRGWAYLPASKRPK